LVRNLTLDELEKATRNIQRVEAYLVPRVDWTLSPGDVDTIEAMRRSVGRLADRVGRWGLPTSVEHTVSDRDSVESLPPATLDSEQIAGFASFLERLDGWFASSGAAPPSPDAGDSAGRLARSLDAVRRALEKLCSAPSASQPVAPADRGVETSRAVDDVYAGSPQRERHEPPPPAEQLALTAFDVDPMYRWVGPEEIELTELARERIEQLFASQGITYFRYQLENFIEEIRRRVMNAPEGHVLVIKVRGTAGDRKPFLSYVPKSSLADD
jgi:hypothetical protein